MALMFQYIDKGTRDTLGLIVKLNVNNYRTRRDLKVYLK